jgi:signal transduction histidine kinase
MAIRIRHIATRFALILAAAAVLPLVAYGVASILSLQRGTRETVVAGNLNVARRAAEEIRRYVSGHAEILKALGADLQGTELAPWQKERIVRNYVLQFREFREITLVDASGGVAATSRVGPPRVSVPKDPAVTFDGVAMSRIQIDQDQLPTSVFAIELKRLARPDGWLVGEINLEEMWRMVDAVRIGAEGFAMVLAPDGTLVAHGNPDRKALVAQSARIEPRGPATDPAAPVRQYVGDDGREILAVEAAVPSLGWTLVVEQPTAEAFAGAIRLQRQLLVAIGAGLLVMIAVGWLFGRRFIAPIFLLQRATHGVASGRLETRVHIDTGDEFGDLGQAFNSMADRLVELQEDVKRQERQAMFGRMAAGIVHDLSHPVQNIGNSTRLLQRDDLDAETRDTFHRTIDRELATLKRFMDDLRHIVKPKPIERFAMDVNTSVAEIVDSMKFEGDRHGVIVEARYAAGPLTIEGDRFALGRVYRNLITNAIQATQPGGRVTVSTERRGDRVAIGVSDTGSGIPTDRLPAIFDDFVTTKRRGLGLGLAISKRIVEQLGGTIQVESEVGKGTSFTLEFPASDHESAARAAAS